MSLGPPVLRDGLMFRIVENRLNFTIDLGQTPAAFPKPTLYTWTRNGIHLSGPLPILTYSTITFASVHRTDAGSYVISATNYVLGSNSVPIGSDTGNFSLDVVCKNH